MCQYTGTCTAGHMWFVLQKAERSLTKTLKLELRFNVGDDEGVGCDSVGEQAWCTVDGGGSGRTRTSDLDLQVTTHTAMVCDTRVTVKTSFHYPS